MKKKLTIVLSGIILFSAGYFANDLFQQKNYPPPKYNQEFRHFDKKQRLEMKERFKQRLNLTEQQARQAEKFHREGKGEMRPLFEEIHRERGKLFRLIDQNASETEIQAQKQKIKSLKNEIDTTRERHMHRFEGILDENQKYEFHKMRNEFKGKIRKYKKHGFCNLR